MTLHGSETVGFGATAKPLANARGSDRSHDRQGVVSSMSVKSRSGTKLATYAL
jgi:hypothetical protein